MIINHNLSSMSALHALNGNANALQSTLQHLSSGKRINGAADDAAGLAISEKMKGQIDGLDQATRNSQDGISMIQTAEGALNETHSILQRMRDLATQSANDTNTSADRKNIQQEVDQLAQEMSRISNTTEFNTQNLLAGGLNDTFQIGANAGQTISVSVNAMDAFTLGVARDVTTTSGTGANNVASATFTSSVGDKVVNGANLSFTYAAASTTAAKAADVTGTTTPAAATAGDAGNLVLSVDGVSKTVAITTGDTLATIVGNINTAFGGSTIAKANGGKLELTSTTTGSTSSVGIDPSSTAATLTYLGLSSGTTNGTNASTTAAHVTVSDGTTSSDINVADPTANTFSTSSDSHFGGVTITLAAGKKISDLTSSDTLAVSSTVSTAKAAVVSNGQVTTKAVADGGIDVSSSATAASNAITTIDTAIQTVSAERAKLGAYQNRLDHTINNLSTASENLTSASSRITDVDMAQAMSEFTKDNVLQQAAVSMLAQANQQPQMVLKLLG